VAFRVLLAGAWRFEIYEAAFAAALERRGVEVHPFSWHGHLRGRLGRAQEKWLLPGPALARANRDLVSAAARLRPDVIFIWRGTIVDAGTVAGLRRATGAMLVSYNNDDPFSWRHQRLPRHHERSWRRYLDAVPSYDVHFVYRPINVTELKEAGARVAHVLKPYFVPHLHRPVVLSEDERARFQSTAVFAGHFEDDGRAACIRALAEAGIDVRVFGGDGWRQALQGVEARVGPFAPALGEDYARALCGATAGLCFLSRLNRDSYTRRCFEIPACGTVLVSERTDDLAAMFRDGDEAVLFSTRDELVEKVRWLAGDDAAARRIAAAGLDRVHRDRHSVDGRAQEWLDVVTAHLAGLSATS
jgi:glycosyltransferase involved in cell wall biosynthesis